MTERPPTDMRVLEADTPAGDHLAGVADTFADAFTDFVMPARFEMLKDVHVAARFELARSGPLALADTQSGYFRSITDQAVVDRARPGLMLCVMRQGPADVIQDGRTSTVEAGDVFIFHTAIASTFVAQAMQSSRLAVLPEGVLLPDMGDPTRLAGLRLGREQAEVAMLSRYLTTLDVASMSGTPALGAMVSRHLSDILAASVTRMDKREDPTSGRGLRALRLAEAKRLVDRAIGNPLLNADRIGKSLGVSGRYIQKLFEEDGTTFSAYLMERRLRLAFERLIAAPADGPTVARIAEDVGFSDPSHFSRAFRKRFGETPGSVRGGGR